MEEPDVDRLYALPLDEFTQSRDELAARMRTAGDATEAARVKAMRKPTAPAWTVNQLARRYPKQIEVLIAASDQLRRAQQDLLEGAPAGDLWEATLAEREAVGELIKAAEWILKESGLGSSRGALDRISDTLYAAAADPTGRTLLRRGLITHEMRRAGFGDMIVPPPTPARGKTAAKPKPPKPAKPEPAPAHTKPKAKAGPTPRVVLDAERVAARAAKEADRADEDAERLSREAERAGEEAHMARKRADAATKAATDAHAEASAARREAAELRREAERAEARLVKIRKARG